MKSYLSQRWERVLLIGGGLVAVVVLVLTFLELGCWCRAKRGKPWKRITHNRLRAELPPAFVSVFQRFRTKRQVNRIAEARKIVQFLRKRELNGEVTVSEIVDLLGEPDEYRISDEPKQPAEHVEIEYDCGEPPAGWPSHRLVLVWHKGSLWLTMLPPER